MAKEYVDFVCQSDGLAFLLADNHECAVPRKAHMMFEQDLTPQEQLDYSIELFKPIRRNIKGSVTGNHAWRAYHDSGLEMDKIMMQSLGLPHQYFGWQGYVDQPIGDQRYRIVFAHGNNVGRNMFLNCEKMNTSYPTGDIFATSHTHYLGSTPRKFWDFKGGRRISRDVEYVSTGSLLDQPLYALQAMYQPQKKGFAICWLGSKDRVIFPDTSGLIPNKCPL